MTSGRQPFESLPLAQQAGIMCNDDRFQKFAAIRSGFPGGQFCASAAAEYLRSCCKIDSRRALEADATAQANFARLRTDFDAWRGRIAAQR
ncbi:MAG: hypothetical protein HWE26_17010 [Alteromonadaceae bacterium]|nr:hypothetical protein [Alteromonadaceae bacterium]